MIIPTYIINLKSRTERKENVIKEFEGKKEFNITIVEAIVSKKTDKQAMRSILFFCIGYHFDKDDLFHQKSCLIKIKRIFSCSWPV